MARILLLQTGQTVWDVQDRFESTAGAPLSPEGERTVLTALRELPCPVVSAVYASKQEAARQTATLAAKAFRRKVKVTPALHDLDYGLWQGMTATELHQRHPKTWRQWAESPASVRPPDGETLDEADQRLRKAIRHILHKHQPDDNPPLLVLRPMMLALLQCIADDQPANSVWQQIKKQTAWADMDIDPVTLQKAAVSAKE